MSEVPDRVRRAFSDHGDFEQVAPDRFVTTSTPFDATVDVADEGGPVAFEVTVRVPMLSAVADGVAPVVEDGWFETLELRLEDVDGALRGDRDAVPTVRRAGDEAIVEYSFTDINERRGVQDARAVVDYVQGTFVQGIIPGYEYEEPAASLLSEARTTGDTGGDSLGG